MSEAFPFTDFPWHFNINPATHKETCGLLRKKLMPLYNQIHVSLPDFKINYLILRRPYCLSMNLTAIAQRLAL